METPPDYFFAGARDKPLVAVVRKAERVQLPERRQLEMLRHRRHDRLIVDVRYFSSLNACVQLLFRNPGMHHSMHSGSIARAASTFPISAMS